MARPRDFVMLRMSCCLLPRSSECFRSCDHAVNDCGYNNGQTIPMTRVTIKASPTSSSYRKSGQGTALRPSQLE